MVYLIYINIMCKHNYDKRYTMGTIYWNESESIEQNKMKSLRRRGDTRTN